MTGRFELNNFSDLYEKAKRDYQKIENEAINSDNVFNFLCTIAHLPEWALADDTFNAAMKADAEAIYKQAGTKGHALFIVRELCNSHKHFEATKDTPITVVSAAGWGVGRYGMGGYGVGEPSYKIESDTGKVSFLSIAKDAMEIWIEFAKKNGIEK